MVRVFCKFLQVGDHCLVILDTRVVVEFWKLNALVFDKFSFPIVRKKCEMSGSGGEYSVQKWWTSSCSLRHNEREVPFRVANIKLDESAILFLKTQEFTHPWS